MRWKMFAAAVAAASAATAVQAQFAARPPSAPAWATPASGQARDAVVRWARVRVDDPVCALPSPAAAARPDRPIQMVISLQVDAAGHATSQEVPVKADGYAELQAVVADFVARCPIEPARDGQGQAVAGPAWVTWSWDSRTAAATIVAGRPALILKIATCRPEYPVEAQRAVVSGTTVLRVSVDASGRPTDSEIVKSAGPTPWHQLLDEATRSLLRCRFLPARDGYGAAIAGTADVDTDWKY